MRPIPSSRRRVFWGGIGALAPIVAAGITIDLAVMYAGVSAFRFPGYLTRSVILFCVGGLFGYLNKKETDAWRAFVVGISAPAVLTTLLAGQAAQPSLATGRPRIVEQGAVEQSRPSKFTSRYFHLAQAPDWPVKSYCSFKNEDLRDSFLGGFFGRTFAPYWVVGPAFANADDARRYAIALEGQLPLLRGWKPDKLQLVKFDDGTFTVAAGYNMAGTEAYNFQSAQSRLSPPDNVINQLHLFQRRELQQMYATNCSS